MDDYPEQDAWGYCACACCCPNGGDGPDQLCSHCRVGIHAQDVSGTLAGLEELAREYVTKGRFHQPAPWYRANLRD